MTTSSTETEDGPDDGPLCRICNSAELPGILHGSGGTRRHPFQAEGSDEADWVPPKAKPTRAEQKKDAGKPQSTMVIMPAPDLALRSLMVAKGLIIAEELEEADNALRIPRHSDPVRADRGDAV